MLLALYMLIGLIASPLMVYHLEVKNDGCVNLTVGGMIGTLVGAIFWPFFLFIWIIVFVSDHSDDVVFKFCPRSAWDWIKNKIRGLVSG